MKMFIVLTIFFVFNSYAKNIEFKKNTLTLENKFKIALPGEWSYVESTEILPGISFLDNQKESVKGYFKTELNTNPKYAQIGIIDFIKNFCNDLANTYKVAGKNVSQPKIETKPSASCVITEVTKDKKFFVHMFFPQKVTTPKKNFLYKVHNLVFEIDDKNKSNEFSKKIIELPSNVRI